MRVYIEIECFSDDIDVVKSLLDKRTDAQYMGITGHRRPQRREKCQLHYTLEGPMKKTEKARKAFRRLSRGRPRFKVLRFRDI
ncbi:hypothetical protein LCGC14_2534100 [marine sediment metagenome]|uniref:Uncharacterized protein n=1 Tax=marine sediment metagenome TaxID=412755 RepID=A0A0F9AT11_9ZZZZ